MKTTLLKLFLLTLLACGAPRSAAYAATFNWMGGFSAQSWADPLNWPLNTVLFPGAADDAVFSGAITAPDWVDLPTAQSVQSMDFNLPGLFQIGTLTSPSLSGPLTLGYSSSLGASVNRNGNGDVWINTDVNCGPNLTLAGGPGDGVVRFHGNILGTPIVTVNGGTNSIGAASGPLTLNGLTVGPLGRLEIGVSNNVTVNTPVTVAGGGTLRLCSPGGGTFTAPSINVAAGGTIYVNSTVYASMNINGPGTTFSAGCSPGTLNLTGNLNLVNNPTLDMELDIPGVVGGANDLIDVTGNVQLNGVLNVTAGPGYGPGMFTLLKYTGTLTGGGLTLGSMPANFGHFIDTVTTPGVVKLFVYPAITPISYTGTTLTENFDSMGSGGTTTPAGWVVGYSGPTNLNAVVVNDGSTAPNQNAGWNVGLVGDGNRALGVGATTTGTPAPPAATRFVAVAIGNDTAQNLSTITVLYDGEIWRTGGNSNGLNGLVLQYSTDGLTYVNMGSAFNFTQTIFFPLNSARNGNLSANRAPGRGGTYALTTPAPPGSTFFLRWFDTDNANVDPILAVDNFSFSAGAPPVITAQPQSQTVIQNGTATFSVSANGSGSLSYQWRRDGVPIAGATNATLTLPSVPLSGGGSFTVRVCELNGCTDSASATLTVLPDSTSPTLVSASADCGNPNKVTVVFSELLDAVSATDLFNYAINSGSVSIRNVILAADGKTVCLFIDPATPLLPGVTYTLMVGNVTDLAGNPIAPNPVSINVACPPVITVQPQSQTVVVGASVTLTVAATGAGPLSYQWRFSTNGDILPGATNATLHLPNFQVTNAGNYRVVVSSPFGGSTTSAPALLAAAPPCIQSSDPVLLGLVAWWPLDELPTATMYAELINGTLTTIQSGPLSPPNVGGPLAVSGKVAGASYFRNGGTYGHAQNSLWLNFGNGSFSLDSWVMIPICSLPFRTGSSGKGVGFFMGAS